MSSFIKPMEGCIVVVAKCPLPGTSKTRLAPLLGSEGAASLAKAMLSDVLVSLSPLKVPKILLYAPGNMDGWNCMSEILLELRLFKEWVLVPMVDDISSSLTSSDLGTKLSAGLIKARTFSGAGGVIFVGMDSPELPLDEIQHALYQAVAHNTAFLCPAQDGGYGMLCVPPSAPLSIFQGVQWSHPLTAVSQLKALTDVNIPIILGRLMYDVDEPMDVHLLAKRLVVNRIGADSFHDEDNDNVSCRSTGNLFQSSSGQAPSKPDCMYTWNALVAQEIIVSGESGSYHVMK